jgi:hypothetical protein
MTPPEFDRLRTHEANLNLTTGMIPGMKQKVSVASLRL